MKIAISVAQFFAAAITSALQTNNYRPTVGIVSGDIFLVDTTAKTYFRGNDAGTRLLFNPATQFADFLQIISAGTAPAVAATPAPRPAAVAAPVRTTATQLKTVGADGADIRVGDIVRANNPSGTKPKFRLSTTVEYLVDRITAKGAIGLSSPSDHEYLAKRFTKVRSGSATAANTVSSTTAPAATPRPVPATDINGRTISVGDYVVVKKATRRDGRFSLVADSIAKVTVVTPKGNVGFGGRDQYLGKRFQKVTLADVSASSVRSGDKLLCVKDGSRAIFNLPKNKAVTFRGLTVDGGKFILDGFNEHQYAPSRFKKLVF